MYKRFLLQNLPVKHLCLMAIATCFILTALPQKLQIITGTIVDSLSTGPLPGVSVQVSGTTKGTQTDANGKYTISAPPNSTLIFHSVGYFEKRVTVGNQNIIDISLFASKQNLSEVVVVAYGKQKKASITGAIATIQTKEIKQSPAANLKVTLAGRLPGLDAIQQSGEPGRDLTQLFIRGQGTVNTQSPIILVDGVERDITYIDPNEIESISILKDASSTALFGVRGANGVILVTTKRGTSEIPEISFTAETGTQDFPRLIKPVNSYDYATLRNLALANDGLAPAYTATQLEHYRVQDDPVAYPNTDWSKIMLKNSSMQQRYNLNISGAAKNVKYFVNAGYLDQGSIFKTEAGLPYDPTFSLKRYNFRANVDMQLGKSTKAFMNLAGYVEKQNMPNGIISAISANFIGTLGSGDVGVSPSVYVLAYMNDLPATIYGPVAPDGNVTTSAAIAWPAYGQLNRSGYINQTRSNVTSNFGMEQSLDFITKGLSIKAVASFDINALYNLIAYKKWKKEKEIVNSTLQGQNGKDSVSFVPYDVTTNTPLTLSGATVFSSLSNFQGYMNYSRNFGKHAITGLVLFQQQQNILGSVSSSTPVPDLPYNLVGLSTRLTYAYNNKYFAEFDAGYNGSEQFAPGRRFGFFPAYSGAWLISNEKFLANNKIITLLKLRGSYGEVGNDHIGSRRFLYLDDITVAAGGMTASLATGQRVNYNSLANPEIQWEVAKKTNIGLELGLFNSLTVTVDVFKENRNNILRNRGTVPILNGLPTTVLPPVNIGIIENGGYEVELNYHKRVNKDLSFSTRANVSYARNKQLYADEAILPSTYAYRYRQTGFEIGTPFGYIVEKYFDTQAEIDAAPKQNVGGHVTRPGDFKYKDLNGDGVVDIKDQAPIGFSAVPEYQFGAAFIVSYDELDLSILFQGVTNVNKNFGARGNYPVNNFIARHLTSWTADRLAAGEVIDYPSLTTQASPNEIANSFFSYDASYIRLKNVELGYTLPGKLSKKIGAKGIRLYANGLNIFTWDRLPTKEFDPEVSQGSNSYPIERVWNIGVNVKF